MKSGVIILYRHQLLGEALQALINASEHFFAEEVVPLDSNGINSFNNSSLVVLETFCPDRSLIEIIQELKKREQKVILIGVLRENSLLIDLLDTGLDGYVLDSCGKQNLIMALMQVNNGKKYYCSAITEVLNHQFHTHNGNGRQELSQREKEILNSLIELKSPLEVSEAFNISEATVRTHRKNIMRKIGAKNVLDLLKYACSLGMLCSGHQVKCSDNQRSGCHFAQTK